MMQKKGIHWYPGHMVKAIREIEERIRVVDVVIELVDARAPISSRNPFLEEVTGHKKRLLVLTKKDLGDSRAILPFLSMYREQGYATVLADLNDRRDIEELLKQVALLGQERQEQYRKRGMKEQPLRIMIIGIPNVGKSTLINRLARRNTASVRNTPGHTRSQQWIRVNRSFELLDTPGILPPHYEDKTIAMHLAWIGSIREIILPWDEVYEELMKFLLARYPEYLRARYGIGAEDCCMERITESIGRKRNLLQKGGTVDEDAVKKLVLKEFRNGTLGNVVVDEVC